MYPRPFYPPIGAFPLFGPASLGLLKMARHEPEPATVAEVTKVVTSPAAPEQGPSPRPATTHPRDALPVDATRSPSPTAPLDLRVGSKRDAPEPPPESPPPLKRSAPPTPEKQEEEDEEELEVRRKMTMRSLFYMMKSLRIVVF
jgi:hypothetical protein